NDWRVVDCEYPRGDFVWARAFTRHRRHNDHHATGRRPRAGVERLPRNRFRLFLFQIWTGIRHAVPLLRRHYSTRGVLDLAICFGKWTIHSDSENSPSGGGVFVLASILLGRIQKEYQNG